MVPSSALALALVPDGAGAPAAGRTSASNMPQRVAGPDPGSINVTCTQRF
ncbi:MAG: hypothetical protein HYR73_08945 [Candidatus Eisenbacteria bacterium]|nr:hypothetical protein [Candidatus Eisenbacteria bacterium]